MNAHLTTILPHEIEATSFAIIKEEFEAQTGRRPADYPAEEFAVIQRVIHATGDFTFAQTLHFHPQAIATAIARLRAGRAVATDVKMSAAGVNAKSIGQWGGRVICEIAAPDIADQAQKQGLTRSETAIQLAFDQKPGIIAIGNAPTALVRVITLCQQNPILFDGVIIGVPVGFVNAAESKDWLAEQDIPHIVALGRKGGSPVAAAIVNALIRLATEEHDARG